MVKNLFLNLSKALVLVGFTMSLLHLFGCSFFQTTPEQEVDLNKVASDIVQAFEKNNIDPKRTRYRGFAQRAKVFE